jgi:ubiquinone/menaquinone biosynthesis C-methylase UbiE
MSLILEKMKCVSCGSTRLSGGPEYLSCDSCKTQYSLEGDIPDMLLKELIEEDRAARISLEFYDLNTKLYDEEWAEYEPWQIELRQKFIKRAKARAAVPEVLEIACGPGRDVAYFTSEGCQMTGVDLSYGQLKRARAKVAAPLYRADMRNLPLQDCLFDAVWCCVALLHVRRVDAPVALAQMQRVLKPGGLLFLSVLWGEGTMEVRREIYNNSPEYYEFYKEAELSVLLQQAGFSIDEILRREAFRGRKTSEVTGGVKTYIDVFARKRPD